MFNNQFENFPRRPSFSGEFWDFMAVDLEDFTTTTVGTGTIATVDTFKHGVLRTTGQATTEDTGSQIQTRAFIALEPNYIYDFMARVKSSDMTQKDFFLGFSVIDTTILASAPSSNIGFRSDDGDALLDCVVRTGSLESANTGVLTLADATWYDLGFRATITAEGVGSVEFFVDGVSKGTLSSNIPASTVLMALSSAYLTGDAVGTKTYDLDYIGARQTQLSGAYR